MVMVMVNNDDGSGGSAVPACLSMDVRSVSEGREGETEAVVALARWDDASFEPCSTGHVFVSTHTHVRR